MIDVIAGQPTTLLAQFYDFSGGTLTDLAATPTITVTSIATGGTALAATTSGVTHPAVGSYGYTWTPGSSLTPGAYLATWSGLSSGSPVIATETITVTAPASSAATNTTQDGYWYATREEIKAELDVKETARSNARIDRAIEDASRRIDGLMHRTFAPVTATRYFDWPNSQTAPSWRLWLDDNELISVTALASGGTPIAPTDYLLEPNQYGPPYNRIEVNLGSDAAFGGGSTHQRDIQITGLYGYRNTETTAGALVEALDATETSVDVDGVTAAAAGVGSILRVDSERMIVTGRAQLDTGQTLGGSGLTNQNSTVTVTVQSGAAFAAGETILIDGERIRVDDIAGNTLIVTRAWDGSTIAAHTVGATIYAPRTLTVTRGALGTTADTHGNAATVYRWVPPGGIRQLCVAEAVTDLLQGRSGYARTAGTGENEREVTGRGLKDLRDRVYASHARKARVRSV
jgi:hypothetical protein